MPSRLLVFSSFLMIARAMVTMRYVQPQNFKYPLRVKMPTPRGSERKYRSANSAELNAKNTVKDRN